MERHTRLQYFCRPHIEGKHTAHCGGGMAARRRRMRRRENEEGRGGG
jgi:hypothetical protein